MISNRARRPRKRCSRMAPSARARNAPAGSAVRPIETAGRRERLPGKREGAGGPGHDIVSIAEHSPEVSEETVPRLFRARRRAIVMFDRDHGEQVPGPRLPVPVGIPCPTSVSCRGTALLKAASMCPEAAQPAYGTATAHCHVGQRADSTEAVRAASTVGPPVRERRRRGPSEGAFGPIEKTDGPNQRTAGLLL